VAVRQYNRDFLHGTYRGTKSLIPANTTRYCLGSGF